MPKTTQIQEIIRVFKKEGNRWMDYNEIYERMDKSLFGPNKYGESGHRRMVYRYLLGNEMFDEDPNSRPKKFRLKSHILGREDIAEVERVYSTGEIKLFSQGRQFSEVKFSHEDEIENEVKANYKFIFGPDSVYFDIKKKIGRRICDGIVFNPNTKRLYIVENELFIHDLYGHIVPQIIEFFNSMRDSETKERLKYDIEWEKHIPKEKVLDIRECIDKSLYDVVVIIDRIGFETEQAERNISELAKHFVGDKNIEIVFREFNVFVDEKGTKIFRVR